MEKNIELFRKILFEIEKDYKPGTGSIGEIEIEDYDSQVIAEHCRLLDEAGLIQDYKPMWADNKIYYFSIGPLTNLGYDFLDEIRDDNLWKQITKKFKENDIVTAIKDIIKISALTGEIISKLIL
jgi:hypothetical protein